MSGLSGSDGEDVEEFGGEGVDVEGSGEEGMFRGGGGAGHFCGCVDDDS